VLLGARSWAVAAAACCLVVGLGSTRALLLLLLMMMMMVRWAGVRFCGSACCARGFQQ
jgi:hypothetical protein